MTAARLVQLYPDELGVAGDRGNVFALTARLAAVGIETEVSEYHRGAVLPDSADVVVVGNGPLSAMRTVLDDLRAIAPTLRSWFDDGVPFFAYGSGAELLGRRIDLLDGSFIDGLGIFPFVTTRVSKRTVGYVVTDTAWGQIVGFEDNASEWVLDAGAEPLGQVSVGDGNGDGREGVLSGSSIATQVGGPVLPLNPLLAGVIVRTVASRVAVEVPDDAVDSTLDDYARRAREVIVAHAAHVFSRI